MKLKVLYIISDQNFGGGSHHLLDLISNLDSNFEPVLISIPSPIIDKLGNKIKVYSVPMKSRLDFTAIKKIKAIIQSEKPDIIHLHSARAFIMGTIAAKNFGIPVIYTEHLFTDDYIPQSQLIHFYQLKAFKFLSKHITKVIAVSGAVKKYFIDKKIFPANKIEIIYHGLKPVNYIKTSANKSPMTIGSIGTLTKIKGYEYLVKAVQNIDNIKMEIMGVGPDLAQLKKLDINKKVKFLGNQIDPSKKMAKWDIYVQPSLSESFGLALAGAMNAGLPVIATKAGGMPELVAEAGILVPAKDTNALRDAIIKLASDKKLREKLSKAAQNRIKKYFTLEKMVKETENLYRNIVRNMS